MKILAVIFLAVVAIGLALMSISDIFEAIVRRKIKKKKPM